MPRLTIYSIYLHWIPLELQEPNSKRIGWTGSELKSSPVQSNTITGFDMHKEFDVKQKKALSIPSVIPLLEAFVAAWLFAMAYRWRGAKLI